MTPQRWRTERRLLAAVVALLVVATVGAYLIVEVW